MMRPWMTVAAIGLLWLSVWLLEAAVGGLGSRLRRLEERVTQLEACE